MTTSATNQYSSLNPVEAFTNGRTAFWAIDLQAYLQGNLFYKIFGHGFDYIYYINQTRYGLRIWAHNDFINVLLCNGILGIITYFYSYICIFREAWKNLKKLDAILLSLFLVIIALINGLFVYQHYLYSFIIIYVLATNFNSKDFDYSWREK
jgi:O-antigen ligase